MGAGDTGSTGEIVAYFTAVIEAPFTPSRFGPGRR